MRVLVIDDDRFVLSMISIVLKAEGYEVTTVQSGPAGLAAFEPSKFDLLIVDIFMPGMDGVKSIKAFRQINPLLPIIAISGVMLRASKRTALDLFPLSPMLAGVTCLQKPFKAQELLGAVLSLIGPAEKPTEAVERA